MKLAIIMDDGEVVDVTEDRLDIREYDLTRPITQMIIIEDIQRAVKIAEKRQA